MNQPHGRDHRIRNHTKHHGTKPPTQYTPRSTKKKMKQPITSNNPPAQRTQIPPHRRGHLPATHLHTSSRNPHKNQNPARQPRTDPRGNPTQPNPTHKPYARTSSTRRRHCGDRPSAHRDKGEGGERGLTGVVAGAGRPPAAAAIAGGRHRGVGLALCVLGFSRRERERERSRSGAAPVASVFYGGGAPVTAPGGWPHGMLVLSSPDSPRLPRVTDEWGPHWWAPCFS